MVANDVRDENVVDAVSANPKSYAGFELVFMRFLTCFNCFQLLYSTTLSG